MAASLSQPRHFTETIEDQTGRLSDRALLAAAADAPATLRKPPGRATKPVARAKAAKA